MSNLFLQPLKCMIELVKCYGWHVNFISSNEQSILWILLRIRWQYLSLNAIPLGSTAFPQLWCSPILILQFCFQFYVTINFVGSHHGRCIKTSGNHGHKRYQCYMNYMSQLIPCLVIIFLKATSNKGRKRELPCHPCWKHGMTGYFLLGKGE